MFASGAGTIASSCERMVPRCDGNEHNIADAYSLDANNPCVTRERPAHADTSGSINNELRHPAESFHVEPQPDRWKFGTERFECIDDARGWQHDVQRKANFRLQPLQEPFHLRSKPVDPAIDRAGLSQNRSSGIGQLRFPRRLPVE